MSKGPYTIVDADTGRPLFAQRVRDLRDAFYKADRYLNDQTSPHRFHPPVHDYKILDEYLNPVPRPQTRKRVNANALSRS